MHYSRLTVAIWWLAACAVPWVAGASASETVSGPVAATVVRVIDGDTLEVAANIWVDVTLVTAVRIRGIDTPELRGRCPSEKAMAVAARDLLAELSGAEIRLGNVEHDKYGGRVVADAWSAAGADLARAMIAKGLARPYDGTGRADWCATAGID